MTAHGQALWRTSLARSCRTGPLDSMVYDGEPGLAPTWWGPRLPLEAGDTIRFFQFGGTMMIEDVESAAVEVVVPVEAPVVEVQ